MKGRMWPQVWTSWEPLRLAVVLSHAKSCGVDAWSVFFKFETTGFKVVVARRGAVRDLLHICTPHQLTQYWMSSITTASVERSSRSGRCNAVNNLSGQRSCGSEDNPKMGFKGVGCVGVEWIHLAEGSIHWAATVSKATNLRFHKSPGISACLSASQDRFCVELVSFTFLFCSWFSFFCFALLFPLYLLLLFNSSQYNVWVQTERPGFDPRQRQRIFPLSSVSRPALKPTQPPVQWVPGVLSGGRPGRDADHSPSSSTDVKNE
jgi:hypothetical protein